MYLTIFYRGGWGFGKFSWMKECFCESDRVGLCAMVGVW